MTAAPGVTVPDAVNPVAFTVGPFSSHEGLSYLMARLSADPDQRLGAVDLVEELGCDPLALVQASAAIASAGISCRDYHDLYIKRREQIMDAAGAVIGAAPAPMAVTWTLSVECADLIERTLTERERRQGPDHPDTIRTRRRLARAWLDAGRPKDAIKHGNRALEGAERVLGPDSLDTLDAVTVLASAHHAARRVRDAIMLYERALEDRERVQGADHPETIGVRGNLASAYHSAGRMPSALDLYERTRADCQRVLGADHPDTLAARANLAHDYYAVGRLSDARTLVTATLADCERALAPGDPLTDAVRDSLAAMADA